MDLICPDCNSKIIIAEDSHTLSCQSCMRTFLNSENISLLFSSNQWDGKNDVTDVVKLFYEENPFPNYEDIDSDSRLRQKAQRGVFARLLDEQIPYNANVLEVGCGTGQLSNFLAMDPNRKVWGTDMCINSLKLGDAFRERNNIEGLRFIQMNLFKPVFKHESFDVVISNGVLHHTSDPKRGFQTIAKLVKPDGYIIIGLYNRYGRVWTDLRRFIFKITGKRFTFLDEQVRQKNLSSLKKHIWFEDQYQHPHESKHTFGEVIKWFQESGFEFTNSIPKILAFEEFRTDENLFKKNDQGTFLDHFLVQLGMILRGREGGFYVMIGRKK